MENIELDEKTLRARYEAQKKRLKAIPVKECKFKEEYRNLKNNYQEKNLVVYYKHQEVFKDYFIYNGDSCYLKTAFELFNTATARSKNSKWFNLFWLIALRDIVRENYNHGLGLDAILYNEKPFTYQRLMIVNQLVEELDPYATVRN